MREAKRRKGASLLSLVGVVVASQVASASSTDVGSLTVGGAGGNCGVPIFIASGYSAGAIGAYSPTVLTGGKNVSAVLDYVGCFNVSQLTIAGFSANPGQNWLISITCNGVTNLSAAGAFSYFSSGGAATWQWSQRFGLAPIGANMACTIVHN